MMTTTDTPNTAAQTPAQETPTEAVNSGSHPSAMTQEDINRLVGKARSEGKAAAVADLLKTLGVASADELKALKDKATALEQASMTEAQKLQAERDQAKKEKEEAIAERDRERAERRNERVAAFVQSEAHKMKADDTETVLLYAREKHKAALEGLIADDGTLDEKKAKALLETIKAEKPKYFAAVIPGAGSPSNANGRAAQTNTDAQKRAYQTNQKLIRG
jgi:hypothetical protein